MGLCVWPATWSKRNEGLILMEIGLAVEFGDRSAPKKARCVNNFLGTWGLFCQEKIKQETKEEPCHKV